MGGEWRMFAAVGGALSLAVVLLCFAALTEKESGSGNAASLLEVPAFLLSSTQRKELSLILRRKEDMAIKVAEERIKARIQSHGHAAVFARQRNQQLLSASKTVPTVAAASIPHSGATTTARQLVPLQKDVVLLQSMLSKEEERFSDLALRDENLLAKEKELAQVSANEHQLASNEHQVAAHFQARAAQYYEMGKEQGLQLEQQNAELQELKQLKKVEEQAKDKALEQIDQDQAKDKALEQELNIDTVDNSNMQEDIWKEDQTVALLRRAMAVKDKELAEMNYDETKMRAVLDGLHKELHLNDIKAQAQERLAQKSSAQKAEDENSHKLAAAHKSKTVSARKSKKAAAAAAAVKKVVDDKPDVADVQHAGKNYDDTSGYLKAPHPDGVKEGGSAGNKLHAGRAYDDATGLLPAGKSEKAAAAAPGTEAHAGKGYDDSSGLLPNGKSKEAAAPVKEVHAGKGYDDSSGLLPNGKRNEATAAPVKEVHAGKGYDDSSGLLPNGKSNEAAAAPGLVKGGKSKVSKSSVQKGAHTDESTHTARVHAGKAYDDSTGLLPARKSEDEKADAADKGDGGDGSAESQAQLAADADKDASGGGILEATKAKLDQEMVSIVTSENHALAKIRNKIKSLDAGDTDKEPHEDADTNAKTQTLKIAAPGKTQVLALHVHDGMHTRAARKSKGAVRAEERKSEGAVSADALKTVERLASQPLHQRGATGKSEQEANEPHEQAAKQPHEQPNAQTASVHQPPPSEAQPKNAIAARKAEAGAAGGTEMSHSARALAAEAAAVAKAAASNKAAASASLAAKAKKAAALVESNTNPMDELSQAIKAEKLYKEIGDGKEKPADKKRSEKTTTRESRGVGARALGVVGAPKSAGAADKRSASEKATTGRHKEIDPLSTIDKALAAARQAHKLKVDAEEQKKRAEERVAAARSLLRERARAKLNKELHINHLKSSAKEQDGETRRDSSSSTGQATVGKHGKPLAKEVKREELASAKELDPLALIDKAIVEEKEHRHEEKGGEQEPGGAAASKAAVKAGGDAEAQRLKELFGKAATKVGALEDKVRKSEGRSSMVRRSGSARKTLQEVSKSMKMSEVDKLAKMIEQGKIQGSKNPVEKARMEKQMDTASTTGASSSSRKVDAHAETEETAGDVQELKDRQAMRDLEALNKQGLLQHGSRQLEHHNSATRAHGEAEERDSSSHSVDADKDTEAERLYAAAHKGQVEAGHEARESHEGHEEDEDARKDTAKETALGHNKMMQLFGSKVASLYTHDKATIAANKNILNNEDEMRSKNQKQKVELGNKVRSKDEVELRRKNEEAPHAALALSSVGGHATGSSWYGQW